MKSKNKIFYQPTFAVFISLFFTIVAVIFRIFKGLINIVLSKTKVLKMDF